MAAWFAVDQSLVRLEGRLLFVGTPAQVEGSPCVFKGEVFLVDRSYVEQQERKLKEQREAAKYQGDESENVQELLGIVDSELLALKGCPREFLLGSNCDWH